MPTPLQEISNYLRNNPGSRIPDAVKGTGYNGPPVKIKEGNLTDKRHKVRVSLRGDNGDSSRRDNIKRSTPPLTEEEKRQNQNQNAQKRRINKRGGNVSIGHRNRVKLTGEQLKDVEERLGTQAAEDARDVLNDSYGGIGDSPGNREIQDMDENNQEDTDWGKVQGRLGEMERDNPSPNNHPNLIEVQANRALQLALWGASAMYAVSKELLFPSFK